MKRVLSLLLLACALLALPGAAPQKTSAAAEEGEVKLADVCLFPLGPRDLGPWAEEPAVLALCDDGSVRTAGLERFFDEETVQRIQGWTNLVQLVTNRYDVAGLKSDGTIVYASLRGEEWKGVDERYDPECWTNVVELIGGYEEFYGLTRNGRIKFFYNPGYDLLGRGECYLDWKGMRKVCFYSYGEESGLFGLTKKGEIKRKSDYYRFPETKKRIRDIDASGWLFCCLLENGRVLVTGINAHEELVRQVESLRGVEQVSAGMSDVAVRYPDGRVEVVGETGYQTEDWRGVKEIFHAGGALLGLTEDGRVLVTESKWGTLMQNAEELASWQGVEQLRVYPNYVLGWTNDGTLLSAGIDLSQLE